MARAIILVLAISWLAPGSLASDEPAQKLTVTKELLYTVPEDTQLLCWDEILSGRRSAYRCKRDGKEFILLDGVEQRAYDSVYGPVFAPNGQRFAYCAETGGKQFIVLDGEEQQAYDKCRQGVFSPDSKRFAYAARRDGEWLIVLDGAEGKRSYDGVTYCAFSADSRHFAHAAGLGVWEFVVLDGAKQQAYRYLQGLTFAPIGNRLAYIAWKGRSKSPKALVVVDGVEEKAYIDIGRYMWPRVAFSPNGKRYAYWAEEGGKRFCVVDGIEQQRYATVGEPVFSGDSEHLAYTAFRGDKAFVVLDGVEQKAYRSVDRPTFSAKGHRLAYGAESLDGEYLLVLDGVEHRRSEDWRPTWAFTFSPDGTSVAHMFDDGRISVGGVEYGGQWTPYPPVIFSPDGLHWACRASTEGGMTVVVDGIAQEPMHTPWPQLAPGQDRGDAFVWFACSGKRHVPPTFPCQPSRDWWKPGSKLYRFVARYEDGEH